MVDVSTAFANFIFKGFNFFGRATRAEYWWVIPALWVTILALFCLDVRDVWIGLQNHKAPSFNPLNHASGLLFFVSLIPRYALTVRRLMDAGRSPRWALLPFQSMVMFVWLVLGIGSAMLASGATEGASSIGMVAGILAMIGGTSNWDFVFAFANTFSGAEIWDIVRSIPMPDLSQMMSNASDNLGAQTSLSSTATIFTMTLVFGPLVMMSIFILMMLMPSKVSRADSYYDRGGPARPSSNLRKSQAFSSYAILDQQTDTPEQAAMRRAQAQVEAKELYRSRVLGQRPAN